MAARTLRCPACGAPVPLSDPRRVTCLFCQTEVTVPPEIDVPVEEARRLEQELAAAKVSLAAARDAARAHRGARLWGVLQLGFGAVMVVGMLGMQVGVQLFARGAVDPSSGIAVGANLLIYAGIGVAMLAGWAVSAWMAARRVRRLPLAEVRVDRGLVPSCPSCAARLTPTGQVSATCAACGAESLLPAALVDSALQARHARILAARGDLGDFQQGQMRSFAVSQGLVGCTYVTVAGVALLAAAGIGLAAALGWGPLALTGPYAALPAALMAGMFAWTGLGQLVAAVGVARR